MDKLTKYGLYYIEKPTSWLW